MVLRQYPRGRLLQLLCLACCTCAFLTGAFLPASCPAYTIARQHQHGVCGAATAWSNRQQQARHTTLPHATGSAQSYLESLQTQDGTAAASVAAEQKITEGKAVGPARTVIIGGGPR